ncbi:MAG: TolC family protein [Myxococcales bacterium]
MQPRTVPSPQQVKPAPVSARKALGDAENDEAAQQLAAALEPTPGGLTADEVVQLTLANSPQLEKSQLEANKASANQARAKLAFAPRLDLLGSYTRLSNVRLKNFGYDPSITDPKDIRSHKMVDGNNPGIFGPFLDQYMAKATLTLPITDWFLTIIPTYKAASKQAEVAEFQRQAQALSVAYEARTAFYDYVHARGGEAVARESVRVLAASVEDLESLVRAGASTPSALARAKAAHANAQALEVQMHGLVEMSLERLSQFTGKTIDPARGIGEPLVDFEISAAPTFQQLLSQAREGRPELKALRAVESARQHLARAKRGAVMPKIAGIGNGYYASPNPRYVPPTKTPHGTWDVGVALTWSPNDATYNYLQAQDAETDLRLVAEDLRAFEQGIAIEASGAVTGHATAAANITAKTEALNAARAYHADQRALMLAGAATPNDVLLAERDLTQAALEWVDAFVNARRAEANILKAQGKTGATNGPVQDNAVAGSTP